MANAPHPMMPEDRDAPATHERQTEGVSLDDRAAGAACGPEGGSTPPLPDRDLAFMERALRVVERLLLPYHRASLRGIEHVPHGPVLFVGNHNGATYSGDTWIFAVHLWRALGVEAMPHGLGHDFVFRVPILGNALRRVGAVNARPDAAEQLLRGGRNVMVYPGGDLDAMRPHRARNEVRFGGRHGFVRTALRAGVPIVPVAAQGAHDTLFVLDDGVRLARLIGADRRWRMKVWPVALTMPWGLTVGPTPPYLPFPARIRMEVLPPVRFDRTGEDAANDEAYVAECAAHVEALIQAAVLRLAKE